MRNDRSEIAPFYRANARRIEREVRLSMPFFRRVTARAYGKTTADEVIRETMLGFRDLLPDLPFIGGWQNPLTTNLYQSAALLSYYRALQARGKQVAEIGRLIYQAVQAQYTSFPFNLLLWFSGRTRRSLSAQARTAERALISQKQAYSGDWVFSFLHGREGAYDWGVDYTECGICKLLHTYQAQELTPYLCALDYPMVKAMGLTLNRTTTLAEGGPCCDFRLIDTGAKTANFVPPIVRG